jgi:2-dehydropantoate 2-reductase
LLWDEVIMRVTLYGAGAIGCYLAAHLADVPGIELSLIARGASLSAIRRNGIRLIAHQGERRIAVFATDDPASLPVQDVVFITLTAHQVAPALDGIASLLGPETMVLPPSTGIPWWYFHTLGERQLPRLDLSGRQWAMLRPERVIGCTFWVGADLLGPGEVYAASDAAFPIGEPSGLPSARIDRLHDLLTRAGLRAPIRKDIRAEIWAKMINSLVWNPLAVLTGVTLGELGSKPDIIALAAAMMVEAEAVAQAVGASMLTPAEKRIAWTLSATSHKMSMLQDFERGKQLEYPILHESIMAMRELTALTTPMIDRIYALLSLRAPQPR